MNLSFKNALYDVVSLKFYYILTFMIKYDIINHKLIRHSQSSLLGIVFARLTISAARKTAKTMRSRCFRQRICPALSETFGFGSTKAKSFL